MWWKVVLFVAITAVGLWIKYKVMDNFVAQHSKLNEEEEN